MTLPSPTLSDAEELEVAAKIAAHRGDLVFAKLLRERAQELRGEYERQHEHE